MERDLKFRVWDDKNKKWLLGYDYPRLGGFSMIGEVMLFGEYSKELSNYSLADLDSLKIMQFTGMTNNGDKDIYEGDKVYIAGKGVMDVIFYCSAWAFESDKEVILFNEVEWYNVGEIISHIYA